MKKLFKFLLVGGGILLALFILLLIVAAIAIPILLPPAKMKSMVTEKLSAAIHHKVSVGDIHFNVLSGFDVKDLVISNRAGWASHSPGQRQGHLHFLSPLAPLVGPGFPQGNPAEPAGDPRGTQGIEQL